MLPSPLYFSQSDPKGLQNHTVYTTYHNDCSAKSVWDTQVTDISSADSKQEGLFCELRSLLYPQQRKHKVDGFGKLHFDFILKM